MSGSRRVPLAALLVALSSIAWLDPHARTREANRLFAAGKYDDAASAYNEELVDHPDSSLLHFNLADAQYKQGKYDDALATFALVRPGDDDKAATARAAYNTGNANYRLAEGVAATDPKAALDRYAQALIAYRRAIVAVPGDADAKLNYELTMQKRAELQKKLEEQHKQQQQGQQQQDQQQDDKPQDQRGDQQQANQEQKQDGAPEPGGSPQPQQDAAAPPQAQPSPAEQGGAGDQAATGDHAGGQQQAQATGDGSEADERRDGEMTRQEAAALLDAQRTQEVQPGEIVHRLQGAAVAEPAMDW